MAQDKTSHTKIITTVIYFALTALAAILLLIMAFVIWLAELLGSLIGALLITGIMFGVISMIIYHASLQTALENLQHRLNTIYEVAQVDKRGYDWAVGKFSEWIAGLK